MADYLSSVLARAVGTTSAIRPHTPSLFEPPQALLSASLVPGLTPATRLRAMQPVQTERVANAIVAETRRAVAGDVPATARAHRPSRGPEDAGDIDAGRPKGPAGSRAPEAPQDHAQRSASRLDDSPAPPRSSRSSRAPSRSNDEDSLPAHAVRSLQAGPDEAASPSPVARVIAPSREMPPQLVQTAAHSVTVPRNSDPSDSESSRLVFRPVTREVRESAGSMQRPRAAVPLVHQEAALESSRPIINVVIERLNVQSATAPVAVPRATLPTPGPSLSLEQYLQRRAGQS